MISYYTWPYKDYNRALMLVAKTQIEEVYSIFRKRMSQTEMRELLIELADTEVYRKNKYFAITIERLRLMIDGEPHQGPNDFGPNIYFSKDKQMWGCRRHLKFATANRTYAMAHYGMHQDKGML